jgi:hypothetical protein
MKIQAYKNNPVILLPVLVALSIAFCAPAFYRNFASDDYCTLDNIVNRRNIWVAGFFRPVGDLTTWLNYKLAGLTPWHYYLMNAVLHGINAWLVFVLCSKLLKKVARERRWFPVAAAFIFLTYHSLGEAVFWMIGRGISLSVTFLLVAFICFFSSMRPPARYASVSLLYFIALSSYENVLLFPLMLAAAIFIFKLPERLSVWVICLISVLLINLLLRWLVTGAVWSAYQGLELTRAASAYAATLAKTLCRVFVPWNSNPSVFAAISFALILALFFFTYQSSRKNKLDGRILSLAWIGIFLAVVPAVMYGVSTRTSEGDRMLYLPSVFYAILVAGMMTRIQSLLARNIFTVLVCAAQLYFFSRTRDNWIIADNQVQLILEQVRAARRPLYLDKLPGDFKGAYQLRNCFYETLRFHGIPAGEVYLLQKTDTTARTKEGTIGVWNGKRLVMTDLSAE